MRLALYAAALLVSSGTSAIAAAPQACNATVDVIDPDPQGTHVRATPGGAVVATLRLPREGDDWIEVHIVAQAGDWFLIDRAELVGDDRKTLYRGKGYMHRSVLGSDGLINGEPIRAESDMRSPQILASEDADQQVQLLACRDSFMKIRVKGGTGWTSNLCLNQRTTCP